MQLYLHSFPTRRSSDLIDGHDQVWLDTCLQEQRHVRNVERGSVALSGNDHRNADGERGGDRSGPLDRKEHTSELQSPCNIVCRLLLEKKKHKKQRLLHI